MSNENKVACVFSQVDTGMNEYGTIRYNSMAKCAINSFKKFNPEVVVHYVDNDNIQQYAELMLIDLYEAPGVTKVSIAKSFMEYYNYTKIIVLDIDTITCARLDEFLDDNTDVLCTLNYPCQESTEYWQSPILEFTEPSSGIRFRDHGNVNGGAMCFNSFEALKKVLQLSIDHYTHFAEQGALNELAWVDKSYPVKIVDFPYPTSQVVYNARSKGVYGTNMCNEDTPQTKFYVKDNKLFTFDGKQIKLWHYIEGLGCQNNERFKEIMDSWIFKLFNTETKKFFKEQCDCGDFFEKEYNILGV